MKAAQSKNFKKEGTKGQGSSVNFRFAITFNACNTDCWCCCKL
jgi:hypothetical protein